MRAARRVVILEDKSERLQGEDELEVSDAQWAALMEAAERARNGSTVNAATVLEALSRRR